ncbi:MAG: PorV/PorQ family protein [bacterium]
MKKQTTLITFGLGLALCLSINVAAQENQKLAQTGLQFLSVVSDARAAALANAMTGLEARSSALFFNPATMGFTPKVMDASFSLNQWIADINHNAFSLSIRPAEGEYGVFGASLQTVDYGEILGTRVAANEQGYEEQGNISASGFAFGIGYAKALSDRFAVGGQIKLARQNLGNSIIPTADSTTTTIKNEAKAVAFDFGTYYKTGLESFVFGFTVRNFSEEIEYAEESFQLPLVFSIGGSMNLVDLTSFNSKNHSAFFSIQATNDRSHRGQVGLGLEYTFMSILALRGGYITNSDEDDVSFGFGVSGFGFQADYGYTPFGVFDHVQRVTVRFSK